MEFYSLIIAYTVLYLELSQLPGWDSLVMVPTNYPRKIGVINVPIEDTTTQVF
jgi:hypothetical protein